jgi:hypothetical protein
MRNVHCDGCGFIESDELSKSERKIGRVTLQQGEDPRWTGDGQEKFKADLCSGCLALLLHTYFKVPLEGKLELDLPTFVIPEKIPEPQSLKA